MGSPHGGKLPVKHAINVHETGIVGSGADFGAGSENAAELVGQHGRGDFHVFDSECSAEAAALVGFGQIDQCETAHLL